MFQKPNKLKKGDKIGIFVPASPVKGSYRRKGLTRLRNLGYSPVEAQEIMARTGYVAKSSGDNFDDIQSFFNMPDIKALWAARGGYGSNYLLPLLKNLVIQTPKIVMGSSDLSVLLWNLMDRFQMVVFYGPMVFSALSENRVNTRQMKTVLEGLAEKLRIGGKVLIAGQSGGILTGGCLSNLVSLIGTPFFPKIKDRILILEDTGERPYRLDRMMWQIYQNGILSNIRGLVLGQFPRCFKDQKEKIQFFSKIKEYLRGVDVPVVYDLPLGHSDYIETVPLGIEAEINTSEYSGLMVNEKAVQ
jgi:muramoyltetrapeptide carboxypeptidase